MGTEDENKDKKILRMEDKLYFPEGRKSQENLCETGNQKEEMTGEGGVGLQGLLHAAGEESPESFMR